MRARTATRDWWWALVSSACRLPRDRPTSAAVGQRAGLSRLEPGPRPGTDAPASARCGQRQHVPAGVRRVRGRLLPHPAELLRGVHRGRPEAQQHHRELGLRDHRGLPLLAVDGVVPLRHQGRSAVQVLRLAILPDAGSTNPYVVGNKILATPAELPHLPDAQRHAGVGRVEHAVATARTSPLLPSSVRQPGVSIVSRSYWSFSNYGLGDYDRFGYGGPTNTPAPTIRPSSPTPRPAS